LSYVVNGVPVTKSVTRQTWRSENLGGNYYGGFAWDQYGCRDPADNDHYEVYGELQFNHFGDDTIRVNMKVTSALNNGIAIPVPANTSATITGPYTQSGHVGRMQGTLTFFFPPDTATISLNLFEIERSINGITGRLGSVQPDIDGCNYNGRFGGVRR
jgi:hypothetical protein